jgi:hypothetical protein
MHEKQARGFHRHQRPWNDGGQHSQRGRLQKLSSIRHLGFLHWHSGQLFQPPAAQSAEQNVHATAIEGGP